MKKKVLLLIVGFIITLKILSAASTSSTNYKAQIVVASGGGKTNSSLYNLFSVIGQPIVGKTNSSLYNAWLGFFYGRFYLLNTAPTTPTLSSPKNNTRQIGNLANLTYSSTDSDGDTITYYVYGDTSTDPSTNIYTGTNQYYEWATTDGQTYYWKVRATDGKDWSGYSEIWKFTENTKPTHDSPVISPSSPATTDNLTCTPQNGNDAEGDPITYVHNWKKNGVSITVLNMPFDFNASIKNRPIKDYSGHENNGTNSGAKWVSNGKVGGAYEFNGSQDYINITHDTSLSFSSSDNFAVAVWFKTDEPSDTSQFVISKGAGVTSYNYKIELAASGIQFIISNSTGQQAVSTSVTPAQNQWYHAVLVYNGSHMLAYVNGTYKGNKQISEVVTNTDPVSIGRYQGGGDYYFNGTIDEIKVFNSSLSAEQIYQIYQEELNQLTTSKIVSNETTKGDTWLCEVTPVDGYEAGLTKSDSVTIGNSPPPKVTLVSPENDTTTYNRSQLFNWSAVTDPDGDPVTYNIAIATDSSFNNVAYNDSGLSATNYTPSSLLDVDTIYWWKVRAYDGSLYGEYSDVWNVSVLSLISIALTVSNVDFRELQPEQWNDTTDNSPPPLRVVNNGNVFVNISIKANDTLFENANLGEKYFQTKADEYESGCYDPTQTQTDWMNLTDTLQKLIVDLDFNNSKDEAEIEIRVEVPYKEPTKKPRANLTIQAE
ncbi:hypothetical protein DRJ48_02290 [Candidatus Woesearchaeota archaeon]|nr:MAG: hypothetical protein DRJ48_02290 [Candidatus Woesearchaeota archaeon]